MKNESSVLWILRIGVAGEFIGHGALAIQGKRDWVAWITQLTGVGEPTASTLLLLVGLMDVALALIVLVKPVRPLLLWMAFWGLLTAFIRPIVGQSWFDFVERWANWAAPLALFSLLPEQSEK